MNKRITAVQTRPTSLKKAWRRLLQKVGFGLAAYSSPTLRKRLPNTEFRRITPRELFDRARQALFSKAEAIPWLRTRFSRSADKCFTTGTQPPKVFAQLTGILSPSPAIASEGGSALPERPQERILHRSADHAVEGYFNLLGLEGVSFGHPIDWHLEPTSGKKYPLIPWKQLESQLDSVDASGTGDEKVVWELNRHQHLVALGCAFFRTGDGRYAEVVGNHIALWIHENPPALGINWMSSLEASFRCISWLWSLALIRDWNKWPLLPFLDIAKSLHLQGRHIERYLSTYYSPNTHLTGEALGLYYLGTCLPEMKRSARWRKLGRSILLEQLELQIRPDGVYFEQASWYHRYTADFYTHFILLAERSDDRLPPSVRKRLTALLDHLMWITRPDGTSPYLGDDDGGSLLKLEERAPNDWRTVLSNGAVMFGRGDYKHVANEFAEETSWLLGSAARKKFDRIPAKPPSHAARAFVDGGYYVMRNGWSQDANYLLMDCGPHGYGNCGHAHADALAIEVAARGATVLVDPGTFVYNGAPELRDLFRSTSMHNTLTVDGLSSSVPADTFKWQHAAKCTLRCWHDHPAFTYVEGSHDGYRRLPDPVTHTRTVLFVNREYWLMLDRVDATKEHENAVHFHMAPGVDSMLLPQAGRLTANAGVAVLDIVYPEQQGIWQMTEELVAPCYAAKTPAPVGTYVVRAHGSVALLSVLFPRTADQPAPEIRSLRPTGGKGLWLATPRFRDIVLWSGSAVCPEVIYDTDFEWVWMRRRSDDSALARAALLHGTQIRTEDLELTASRPVEFITASVRDRELSVDIFPSVGVSIHPPPGIEHLVINGKRQRLGSASVFTVAQQDVPALAAPRDETDCCKHVRH